MTGLREQSTLGKTKSVVVPLVNHMKQQGKTVLLTNVFPDDAGEYSSMNIFLIVDAWIRLRRIQQDAE